MAKHTASINTPKKPANSAMSAITWGGGIAGGTPQKTSTGAPNTAVYTPPAAPDPPTPMPWDTNYANEDANLTANYNNTITGLDYQKAQGIKQFGFDDASDPYNNLKMLQKHYDEAKRGALNSMASRGQLYSGAAQNAQNYAAEDYNKSYSDQQKQYKDFLQQNEQARLGAQNSLASGQNAAQYNRLLAALQNGNQ
jgi:hypothetical protein